MCDVSSGCKIIPVLADEFTEEIKLEYFVIGAIKDKKSTSGIVKELCEKLPLTDLPFVKRIKSSIKPDKSSELQAIICKRTETQKGVNTQDEYKQILAHLGLDVTQFTRFTEELVPVKVPLTRHQLQQCQKHWPVLFHEDKQLTALLTGTYFTEEDRQKCAGYLIEAERYATIGAGLGQPAVGAVMVDPQTGAVLAACSDLRAQHPLQHTVMVAIDLIARGQGGGAWKYAHAPCVWCADGAGGVIDPVSKSGPYLCTGYDLYVTHEPCAMCAMALVHSRIRRLFYHKPTDNGALGSVYKVHVQPGLNHHYQVFKVEFEDKKKG